MWESLCFFVHASVCDRGTHGYLSIDFTCACSLQTSGLKQHRLALPCLDRSYRRLPVDRTVHYFYPSCVFGRAFFLFKVLAMENLLRQLERQEGLMSHIQKALGEYLEGQRQVTVS